MPLLNGVDSGAGCDGAAGRGAGRVGWGRHRFEGAPDLSDPDAKVVVVVHRDRSARFGVEHLAAVLSARVRRIVVADAGQRTDDLVRAVIEVLTSMCARWWERHGALNRAMRAQTGTNYEPGQAP
jgi:putative resolvase